MTVKEEHQDVRQIRHRAADASMGFGFIAVLTGALTGNSHLLPGTVLLALGGLAGIGVYAAPDTTTSRRFTLWSASLTVLGVIALVVIDQLAR